ncbi:HAL/PAL/TAL family ammonia-lyase [Herbidospora solisilvae]|uniref:HAL/PAL/TAL family ammonia-lyase n=1 Tax=Herbidospora solisilvae TaxID=2696284 RepID=UPI001929E82A|nr:aromatic amino acid ammonia-lyase [Herbidospora solisilvae]
MISRHDAAPAPADAVLVVVDGEHLTIDEVVTVARHATRTALSDLPPIRHALRRSRDQVRALTDEETPLYGVTTGFGDSSDRRISAGHARELQARLIRFLGCGTGDAVPPEVARAATLIRANNLARGHSGVRPELIELLLDLLNSGITPLIPAEGSVGASGDLVPLSYLAAAVTGERKVLYRGAVRPAARALEEAGLRPLTLEPKEGLALVNGTAYMTGLAALAVADARRLALLSDVTTALTVEVLRGLTDPFDAFVHDVAKPHPGQVTSAANVRALLRSSGLSTSGPFGSGRTIQDKYSIRCAPHFTGVLWDTVSWVSRWVTIEINSSTDNPLFDHVRGEVWAGGNFAGGHVALAMDTLRTAVASVADLMDRQLALVVDDKFSQGLPPNLVFPLPEGHPGQGLDHGFKGMQLVCSSLTAEALSSAMPLTAFSRSTECHNQDKVSMGATAARRTRDVLALAEKVGVIHLLALCQAADLRGPHRLGTTGLVHGRVRAAVPGVVTDRPMDEDVETVLEMLRSGALLAGLDEIAGGR